MDVAGASRLHLPARESESLDGGISRDTLEVEGVTSTTKVNTGRTPGECFALTVEAWRLRWSVRRGGVGVNRVVVVNQRTHEVSTVRSPAAAQSLRNGKQRTSGGRRWLGGNVDGDDNWMEDEWSW